MAAEGPSLSCSSRRQPLLRAFSEPRGWPRPQQQQQRQQQLSPSSHHRDLQQQPLRPGEALETQGLLGCSASQDPDWRGGPWGVPSGGPWGASSGAPWGASRGPTLQLPSSQLSPPHPAPVFSPSHVPALPLWRRLLPLVGGFVVNMQLGCMYSLGNILPYVSSYMRFKGQPDLRHSDLGWVLTAGLASVCLAMACGSKLHRAVGLARCALLGCLLMSGSFLLSTYTCHSLLLFTLTCGAGSGIALGTASVCPLTAAYLAWPEHRGIAAAIVLSGLSASPVLFSALEVSLVNRGGVAFASMPYPQHPYELYLDAPEVLTRVPRLFWGLGCCCLLLAPSALLLNVPHAVARGNRRTSAYTTSSCSSSSSSSSVGSGSCCFRRPSVAAGGNPQVPLDSEPQQQHLLLLPQAHVEQQAWGCCSPWSSSSKVESEGPYQPVSFGQVATIWLVYILLGLAVHFISIFWEALAFALHAPEASPNPEASALVEAQRLLQQQQQPQRQQPQAAVAAWSLKGGFGGGVIAAASLLGRVGWGLMTDLCGGATAVRVLCFCLTVLLGCCAAALCGNATFFLAWLLLLYICVGGISVTLPLVVAEAANPADFSWQYTLAYTSKPASAALASLLLTLCYPSVGLSGCSAFAASAASLALLGCTYLSVRKHDSRGSSWLWDLADDPGLPISPQTAPFPAS